MSKKIILIICTLSLLIGSNTVSSTSTIPDFMLKASKQYGIDLALMYAICTVESNCKHKTYNHNDGTSKQKALGIKVPSVGLFQIKLGTARGLGFKGTYAQLMQPEVNAMYAAKLLRNLYNRYHSTDKVISAYNAGKYTTQNQRYVNLVLMKYAYYKIDRRF